MYVVDLLRPTQHSPTHKSDPSSIRIVATQVSAKNSPPFDADTPMGLPYLLTAFTNLTARAVATADAMPSARNAICQYAHQYKDVPDTWCGEHTKDSMMLTNAEILPPAKKPSKAPSKAKAVKPIPMQ